MLCYSAVVIVVVLGISTNINAYSHSKIHVRSFINRLSSNNDNEVTTKSTKGNYCLNVTLYIKPGNELFLYYHYLLIHTVIYMNSSYFSDLNVI